MGHYITKLDASKMPSYFIAKPIVSKLTCGLLERSLRNVVGYHVRRKNHRLQFVNFYQEFFAKLKEIEPENCRLVDCIEDELDVKSLFLAQLLKLIVSIFKTAAKTNRNRLDSRSKRQIKSFCKQHIEIKLECWGNIGEALFHAMEKCDEMYAEFITEAWINGYSFFLRHFIPIAFRIHKANDKRSAYNLSDEGMSSRTRSQSSAALLNYDGVVLCANHSGENSEASSVCSNSSEDKSPQSSVKDFCTDTKIDSNSNRVYRQNYCMRSPTKRARVQLQDIFASNDGPPAMERHRSYGHSNDIPLPFVSSPIALGTSHETKFIFEEFPYNPETTQTINLRKSLKFFENEAVSINMERRGSCPAVMAVMYTN